MAAFASALDPIALPRLAVLARPGHYYCAPCVTRRLGTAAVWTKRDARRAIAALFRGPIGLTAVLRRGPDPCGDCGVGGGALLGPV